MSYFTPVTREVDLGGGNVVTIQKLTFGEQSDCLSAALERTETGAYVSLPHFSFFRAQKAIVAWKGTGFEGMEVTPDNIGALPSEIGRKIATAIDELEGIV